MNGKNHLVTGAVLAADAGLAAYCLPAARGAVSGVLLPTARYPGAAGYAMWGACALAYLLGTVLPDVDNGGLASKWLHFSLPLAHRGWTHSVWAAALFFLASAAWPGEPAAASAVLWPLRYAGLGMLAHGLMDALSVSGWVPFYPLGRWRNNRGVIMARGFTPSLYSSSRPGSESAVAGAVVILSAAVWAAWACGRFFL